MQSIAGSNNDCINNYHKGFLAHYAQEYKLLNKTCQDVVSCPPNLLRHHQGTCMVITSSLNSHT